MNVRVHKSDFTHDDFTDVREVEKSCGDVVIKDHNWEELRRYEPYDITSIEIRL